MTAYEEKDLFQGRERVLHNRGEQQRESTGACEGVTTEKEVGREENF